MNDQKEVGKNVANVALGFANNVMLADRCQQYFHTYQQVNPMLAKLEVGSVANLPTSIKPAWMLGLTHQSKCREVSLPTGEVNTPDLSRGVYLTLNTRSLVFDAVVAMKVTQPLNRCYPKNHRLGRPMTLPKALSKKGRGHV